MAINGLQRTLDRLRIVLAPELRGIEARSAGSHGAAGHSLKRPCAIP
jgi:hypothetical protein